MKEKDPHTFSSLRKGDIGFEKPLRPNNLDSFLGQDPVCERLHILINAALQRDEAMSHTLFSGPSGLGKTTLAYIIAKSMGANLICSSGPILEKPADLAGILTNLKKGDVFFIDEIHRISKNIEEYLYSAMEDLCLDILIDSGPSARSVRVKLQPFTLVGATTKSGLLSTPLRTRFTTLCRLDFYSTHILQQIIIRTANLLNLEMSPDAALEIAKRARGTPRIANNLLRWVRDFAQTRNAKNINKKTAQEALDMLSIDEKGLDEMDIRILKTISTYYNGGPVGLQTLAIAVAEEATTLSDVYEPFLIVQGFLTRTSRGRQLTLKAYEHIGHPVPEKFNHGVSS